MKMITRKQIQPLTITVLLLLLVIPVLFIGVFSMRDLVTYSFQDARNMHVVEDQVFLILRDQLDEETGVRGYAATYKKTFLEPYLTARSRMTVDIDQFVTELKIVHLMRASSAIADARSTNITWLRTVAEPILAGSIESEVLELRGKGLVDRFRRDIRQINVLIHGKEQAIDEETKSSIDRISLLLFTSVVAIALIALVFSGRQDRLFRRLEGEKHSSADLRVLVETERRVSEMLQETLLQKPLPTLSGVNLSATYVAASQAAQIGGDWYDAVELPEGRVLFVVGDVAGHGLAAAVSMKRARFALISSAILNLDPAALLARVNTVLLAQQEPMVTVVCGYADSRKYQFTYATAGHPAPALLEPGQPPRFLQCGGLPLAIIKDATYRTHTVQTVPGAMLVLYTDGVIEHSRDVLIGEKILLEAVACAKRDESSEPAIAICDAIFRERSVGDDVAILTIAFQNSPHPPNRTEQGYDDLRRSPS